jgi:hypothetical protein
VCRDSYRVPAPVSVACRGHSWTGIHCRWPGRSDDDDDTVHWQEAHWPDRHDVARADSAACPPSKAHDQAEPLQPGPDAIHRPTDQPRPIAERPAGYWPGRSAWRAGRGRCRRQNGTETRWPRWRAAVDRWHGYLSEMAARVTRRPGPGQAVAGNIAQRAQIAADCGRPSRTGAAEPEELR